MSATHTLDSQRWARVAWSHLIEPNTGVGKEIFPALDPVEALDKLRSGDLKDAHRFSQRLTELNLDRQREVLDRLGVRVVIPTDDEWPLGLDDLPEPPVCLYVRGSGNLTLCEGSVAIVGSRASTGYGTTMAATLAEGLAHRGVSVISGAAFGIDAAAHRGSLSAGGPTIAVLACGLDRAYPRAHDGLLHQIAADGLVVSEVPPGWAPMRHRFIARNRLIAALSVGTIVVEAGLRSGSLNTAKYARDLMRHVAAVPGPVTSVQSAGCHSLIRNFGATLVTDTAEVLDLMGRLGLDFAQTPRAEPAPESDLDPVAHAVWSAVPVRGGANLSALQHLTTLDVTTLLGTLGELTALGLIERRDQRWRKVPTTAP